MFGKALLSLFAIAVFTIVPRAASAQECLGPIARSAARVMPAALQSGEVSITYVGHSTFVIESPRGIRAATDYNDYVRPRDPPDIATMNHAHSTHFTYRPDPSIRHVLRGWGVGGEMPRHNISLEDMRVRNVPTNIRAGGGGTEFYGNSIFVFEVSGLCIAHLGHLHHVLTQEHLAALGQIDVLFANIDNSWSMDLAGIVEVINQIKPKLVIPMHHVTHASVSRFLAALGEGVPVERPAGLSTIVSRETLPAAMTVRVLLGGL